MTAQIRTFILDWQPAIAVPREFEFLEEIPKCKTGKADVRTLREFSHKTNEPNKLGICYDDEFSPIIVDI